MTKDEQALIEEITTNYGSTDLTTLSESLESARRRAIEAQEALIKAEELLYDAERALLAECREIKDVEIAILATE